MSKKVAIVFSTYNNQDCAADCINSCLEQDYPNIHIFAADDGSTDSTIQVITRTALETESQARLTLMPLPHRERGAARHEAIHKARLLGCDYLLFIDSDMVLYPGLVSDCVDYLEKETQVGALVVPEVPFSNHTNFFSKVKVFERRVINDAGTEVDDNSIEAARFWRFDEFIQAGGLNPKQISFEEIQPTLRYKEQGGIMKRAVFTGILHNEKKVTFSSILRKKRYYFSKMDTTIKTEKAGLKKALDRWYFFRPVLYRASNIKRYLEAPLLALGMIFMFLALTGVAIGEFFAGAFSKEKA